MERISLTNRVIGVNIVNNQANKVFSRVLVIALPCFHFLDMTYYLFQYAKNFLLNRKLVKLSPNDNPIPYQVFLNLAYSHLTAIFTSIPRGLKDPISALKKDEQILNLPERGVSYQLYPHSRLGDNLSCYFNAKWISYEFNLPLIVRDFPHAHELALSQQPYKMFATPFSIRGMKKFTYEEFEKHRNEPILWELPFFAFFTPSINWNDETFRQSVIKDLEMLNSTAISQPSLVPNRLNMALHLRTGGNFDFASSTYYFPTKIPPKKFFEDAVKMALEKYANQPVHIQIFTDSVNPAKELELFKALATSIHSNVTLATNNQSAETERQVVSDMIAMSRYSCLIRASSGLSRQSSFIGKPELEITPRSYRINGNQITLEGFQVINRVKDQQSIQETMVQIDSPLTYTYNCSILEKSAFQEHHRKTIGNANVVNN